MNKCNCGKSIEKEHPDAICDECEEKIEEENPDPYGKDTGAYPEPLDEQLSV